MRPGYRRRTRCPWWRRWRPAWCRRLRPRLARAVAAVGTADDVVLVLAVLCGLLAVVWALSVLAP